MPHTHDSPIQSFSLLSALCCRLLVIALLACCTPVMAHHGGLGIEGDLVQWALKVDQWQDENIAQGHRVKFLSYPRQPIVGNSTRLVFEIQSTSNNSPPPLIVTLIPFSSMASRSKRMGILQRYSALLHKLSSVFLPALTLYHIYIYRHKARCLGLPMRYDTRLLPLCINGVDLSAALWEHRSSLLAGDTHADHSSRHRAGQRRQSRTD